MEVITKDLQYSYMFASDYNRTPLGRVATARWRRNPETLLFSLSRYKFVTRLMSGKKNVIEVGCGDGWASMMVARKVDRLILTDYDEVFVSEAKDVFKREPCEDSIQVECRVHNFVDSVFGEKVDGVFGLDVLEHIDRADEDGFVSNIASSLEVGGICIFGTPTLISQDLIHESKRDPGHINCKDENSMRVTLEKYFGGVQTFSMNDELVHTGSTDLAYYVFGVGVKVG
jgi:2-polyprenyl-3-methyl-5-hydroxy-6-metoxy-1,4-benzoquinol methylase